MNSCLIIELRTIIVKYLIGSILFIRKLILLNLIKRKVFSSKRTIHKAKIKSSKINITRQEGAQTFNLLAILQEDLLAVCIGEYLTDS